MFSACMSLCKGECKRRIRAFSVTAVLMLAAVAAVLVAAGFALSLLYVWLQQIYGSMPALGIIAGGCAALGLILFAAAFWRPAPQPPVHHEAVAPEIEAAKRSFDEAVVTLQKGSRESMIAALSLAIVAGIALGRKL